MKIVIDIEDAVLDCVIDRYADGEMPDDKSVFDMALYAIANGTALPKGHGRLIDADEVSKGKFHFECECDCAVCSHSRNCECNLIDTIPTVIEADREVENESPGEE